MIIDLFSPEGERKYLIESNRGRKITIFRTCQTSRKRAKNLLLDALLYRCENFRSIKHDLQQY